MWLDEQPTPVCLCQGTRSMTQPQEPTSLAELLFTLRSRSGMDMGTLKLERPMTMVLQEVQIWNGLGDTEVGETNDNGPSRGPDLEWTCGH